MQNSVQGAKVKKTKHSIFETVHEALTYQRIIQNTFKTVRNTLAWQQILQNTFKNVRNELTY